MSLRTRNSCETTDAHAIFTKEIGARNMSRFTPEEIAYMQSQRLGRLATVSKKGDLHVVPVGFRYNPDHDTIDVVFTNIDGIVVRIVAKTNRHDVQIAFLTDGRQPAEALALHIRNLFRGKSTHVSCSNLLREYSVCVSCLTGVPRPQRHFMV